VHRHSARSIAAALVAALALAAPAAARESPAVTGGAIAPPAGAVAAPAAPAIRQTAVQWQVAACLSRCRGARQEQVAIQRAEPPGPRTSRHVARRMLRRSTQRVVQLRLGCLAHCRRASRATRDRARSRGAPRVRARAATVQRIWQVQIGCLKHCTATRQRQRAVQVVRAASLAVATATRQFIWQLQIGCLRDCVRTTESQAAIQRTTASTSAPARRGRRQSITRVLARLPPPPGSHPPRPSLISWLRAQLARP
jgi:hypothetical protein